MEQLSLTTSTTTTTSSYKVLVFKMVTTPACIDVVVIDNNGVTSEFTYSGQTAATLLSQINTGNFTTTSLQKAIINRLVTDGFLPAGSVVGTPQ